MALIMSFSAIGQRVTSPDPEGFSHTPPVDQYRDRAKKLYGIMLVHFGIRSKTYLEEGCGAKKRQREIKLIEKELVLKSKQIELMQMDLKAVRKLLERSATYIFISLKSSNQVDSSMSRVVEMVVMAFKEACEAEREKINKKVLSLSSKTESFKKLVFISELINDWEKIKEHNIHFAVAISLIKSEAERYGFDLTELKKSRQYRDTAIMLYRLMLVQFGLRDGMITQTESDIREMQQKKEIEILKRKITINKLKMKLIERELKLLEGREGFNHSEKKQKLDKKFEDIFVENDALYEVIQLPTFIKDWEELSPQKYERAIVAILGIERIYNTILSKQEG